MARQATYLGRTPEWHADGFGLRPDRRHVRQLLRDLGMEDCQSISTPLSVPVDKEADQNDLPEICADRRIAWTCALRQWSSPGQWRCQEQETKHVSSGWRVTYAAVCPMEPAPGQDGHGDLDYRCGFDHMQGISSVEFGMHSTARPSPHRCMESVHPRVALSSGEAELYASVRGATETVEFMSTKREFRDSSWGKITHRVDASACRAIILRDGCGGLKHITARTLLRGISLVFSPGFQH